MDLSALVWYVLGNFDFFTCGSGQKLKINLFAGAAEEVVDAPASKSRLENVRRVTQEDVDVGKYTIEDVVLPLPGSQMIYPDNDTGKVGTLSLVLHLKTVILLTVV